MDIFKHVLHHGRGREGYQHVPILHWRGKPCRLEGCGFCVVGGLVGKRTLQQYSILLGDILVLAFSTSYIIRDGEQDCQLIVEITSFVGEKIPATNLWRRRLHRFGSSVHLIHLIHVSMQRYRGCLDVETSAT